MTDASYTAWDDKQYVWPPPDGWYLAADEKWWPEGYGPQPEPEEAAAEATSQSTAETSVDTSVADRTDLVDERAGDIQEADKATEMPTDLDSAYEAEDLTSPSLGALPAPGGLNRRMRLDDLGDQPQSRPRSSDDIPSVRDLASPDLNVSGLSSVDEDPADLGEAVADAPDLGPSDDVTSVAPAGLAGEFPGPSSSAPAPSSVPAPSGPAPSSAPAPSTAAPFEPAPSGPTPFGPAPSRTSSPSSGAETETDRNAFTERRAPAPAPVNREAQQATVPSGPSTRPASPAATNSAFGSDEGDFQDRLSASKSKGGGFGKILLALLLLALVIGGILAFLLLRGGSDDSEGAEAQAEAQTGPGSLDAPHPRTTGVVVFYPDDDGVDQSWVIEVLEPISGGEGGEDGEVFASTMVRVRNDGGADGASLGDLRFNAVTASGDLIVREDNECSSTAQDLEYDASVALNGEVEGLVCWSIPEEDLSGLLLGVESEQVAGRVHIALQ